MQTSPIIIYYFRSTINHILTKSIKSLCSSGDERSIIVRGTHHVPFSGVNVWNKYSDIAFTPYTSPHMDECVCVKGNRLSRMDRIANAMCFVSAFCSFRMPGFESYNGAAHTRTQTYRFYCIRLNLFPVFSLLIPP